jgi:hypothetical protein
MKHLLAMLTFVLATAALADEPSSNAPPVEHKGHSPMISISTGDEGEIPKDVTDKLTQDQLFKLMTIREAKRGEDIPGGAPSVVAIVFGMPVVIVALVLFYRYRRNAMLHRTLAAMIDKGVPIPPELLQPEKPRKSDLRRGITLIAVGLGLVMFFAFESRDAVGLGFIPLLIGVGYLIAWKLEQKRPNGQNQS